MLIVDYLEKADGSVEPKKIQTIVISTQNAEPLKATRRKEITSYTGTDMTAISMKEINKLINRIPPLPPTLKMICSIKIEEIFYDPPANIY